MKTVKTRKQGNAIMVTVPTNFDIPAGVQLVPKLTSNGIYYEFVHEDDFFNFDEEILKDLISQGYEGQQLLAEFKKMKKQMPKAIDELIENAKENNIPMTKEQAAKEFGL